jgi:hypothetical protein
MSNLHLLTEYHHAQVMQVMRIISQVNEMAREGVISVGSSIWQTPVCLGDTMAPIMFVRESATGGGLVLELDITNANGDTETYTYGQVMLFRPSH